MMYEGFLKNWAFVFPFAAACPESCVLSDTLKISGISSLVFPGFAGGIPRCLKTCIVCSHSWTERMSWWNFKKLFVAQESEFQTCCLEMAFPFQFLWCPVIRRYVCTAVCRHTQSSFNLGHQQQWSCSSVRLAALIQACQGVWARAHAAVASPVLVP